MHALVIRDKAKSAGIAQIHALHGLRQNGRQGTSSSLAGGGVDGVDGATTGNRQIQKGQFPNHVSI